MDPETKEIYETISCWFVNRYWGELYDNSLIDNSPDSYRATISNFNNSFKSNTPNNGRYDTPYVIMIEKICNYYNTYCDRNKNINQFIDTLYTIIVGVREASEYEASSKDKENVVRNILIKTLDVFTMYIICNEIDYVKKRNNKKRPIIWKDKFEIIFKNKIKQYRDILISDRNGVDIRKQEDQEMVPVHKVEKLKSKIRELYTELHALSVQYNQMAFLAKKYQSMLEQYIQAETPFQEVSSEDILITEMDFSSGDEFSMDG